MYFTITEINGSTFAEIEPLWSRLCRESQFLTPFQSPQWLVSWWKYLGGGNLRLVVVKDEDVVIGILPLFSYNREDGKRIICFLGTGISDYLDIVSHCDYQRIVAEAFWEYLEETRSEWDECDLQDIPVTSILIHYQMPHSFRIKQSEWNTCSQLELPENLDKFRLALSKKLRKNLSRSAKMLINNGGYQIKIADKDSVSDNVNDLFRLHRERWKSKNQSGVLHTDTIQSFHLQASRELVQEGLLRIYSLIHSGRSIAIYYVLSKNSSVYAYLGGFDPTMEKYSPGALLLFHTIEDSLKRGVRTFDFLRGDEQYKAFWNPVYTTNYRIQIFNME